MEDELTPWLLQYGYENGAFPMGDEFGRIQWYQPYKRALFPIEGIHVSRSLAKRIKSGSFSITFDTRFEETMRSCLRPKENWITEDLIRVYTQAHHQGWAHSCECIIEGRLVGGIYGLGIGGCFSAESMFHSVTDASKVALWAMVEKCRSLGFVMFDAQIQNPHLASLGSFEVSQNTYIQRLRHALRIKTDWSCPPLDQLPVTGMHRDE